MLKTCTLPPSNICNWLLPKVDADCTVNITDNNAPGMDDGLYIDDIQVNEQTGIATVTVRVQSSLTAFDVNYATNDGGGTVIATDVGVDYTSLNGTLAFPEEQPSITFNLVIIDDCLIKN